MALFEITRQVIAALEDKSGYSVDEIEDPALPNLAVFRVAREEHAMHELHYRPGDGTQPPDYNICWHCYVAMRLYDCPPEARCLMAASPDGGQELEAILSSPNGIARRFRLDRPRLQAYKDSVLNALLTHLDSVPIGLRAAEILEADHPELHDLGMKYVETQLAAGLVSLSARVREMMPAKLYACTGSINAAYALYWAERLENPELARSYEPPGFDGPGRELLEIYHSVPSETEHDRELIDRWAGVLKLRRWYTWEPYPAP